MDTFDLIVIGSGPGGYTAAIRAAQLGLRTAIVEEDRLGGVCLNWGCIPTKAILHSAEQFEEVKGGKIPGLKVEGLKADYGAVIDASRKAADRLNKGVTGLMRKNKIEVVAGRGRLTGRGKVAVQGKDATREIAATNVLLATGSTELVFPGIEVDGERVLTSREALESRKLPASIIVVGAGAVGLEFAYAYQAYGSEVTVIEMAPQVLPGFDSEVAETLASAFSRRKVKIRTKTAYRGVEIDDEGVAVTVEGEKGEETLRAEQILFGVGRRALSADLGLEGLGVAVDRGFVKTGEDYRTSVEGIWAIGDVRGGAMLAHKAAEEGVAAVEYMTGHRKAPLNYAHIPACVYCQPQVAGVGLSEAQAREAGHDVRIGKFPFVAAGKAVGTGHTEGFVKIVADAKYGEILGAQIIGSAATELIAEIASAMALESTVHEIAEATHAHPTLAEAVKEAALGALGRSLNI